MEKTYTIYCKTRKSVPMLELIGRINDFDFILGSEQFKANEIMFTNCHGKFNGTCYDTTLTFRCCPEPVVLYIDKTTSQPIATFPGLPISESKYSNIWYHEIDFNEIMECSIETQ